MKELTVDEIAFVDGASIGEAAAAGLGGAGAWPVGSRGSPALPWVPALLRGSLPADS